VGYDCFELVGVVGDLVGYVVVEGVVYGCCLCFVDVFMGDCGIGGGY